MVRARDRHGHRRAGHVEKHGHIGSMHRHRGRDLASRCRSRRGLEPECAPRSQLEMYARRPLSVDVERITDSSPSPGLTARPSTAQQSRHSTCGSQPSVPDPGRALLRSPAMWRHLPSVFGGRLSVPAETRVQAASGTVRPASSAGLVVSIPGARPCRPAQHGSATAGPSVPACAGGPGARHERGPVGSRAGAGPDSGSRAG